VQEQSVRVVESLKRRVHFFDRTSNSIAKLAGRWRESSLRDYLCERAAQTHVHRREHCDSQSEIVVEATISRIRRVAAIGEGPPSVCL